MATLFRKFLIRLGKVIPFVIAFILLISYIETIYAIISSDTIVDAEDNVVYNLPISFFFADFIYIDWFDVLLVWILCFALELCKYTFRCAYLITINLVFRTIIENANLSNHYIVALCIFMALWSCMCLYGGIKVIKNIK